MKTTEKTCFKCGTKKSLESFYEHKMMADGHLNKCKECAKMEARKRRHGEGRERVLAYDRMRGNRQDSEYFKSYNAQVVRRGAAGGASERTEG